MLQRKLIAGGVPASPFPFCITFDDGHDSGICSWDYLYDLVVHQDKYWQNYLHRLNKAGKSRDPDTSTVKFVNP